MMTLLIALLLAQPAVPAPDPAAATAPALSLELKVLAPATGNEPEKVLASTTEASARPAEVRLAEPLVLELVARSDAATEVFLPLLPALGGFEIITPDKGLEKVEGDTKTLTRRWQILPVRVGVEKLSAIEVPWRTTGGEGSIKTPALRLFVRGHLENETDPALGAAPPPVDVVATDWALIWALSVLGALVFAGLVGWVIIAAMRQRFEALRPKPPPRPANEVALERLARIEATPADELDGGRRVAETIDTLRDYLGRRYRFDALEMTTHELGATLRSGDLDLRGVTPLEVVSLCEHADLVKFARLEPPDEEARRPAAIVREIVAKTWVEEAKPTEEVVRAEPASLRQRLYAAGVDVMLAGLVGGLALLGLLTAGLATLGFIPIIAVGVLLVLRDAFGPSPGKRILRIAAVNRDRDQTRPTLSRALLRNAHLFLWPLALPIEWLVLKNHPLSLRLGDMWAETEVVRDRRGVPSTTAVATSTGVTP